MSKQTTPTNSILELVKLMRVEIGFDKNLLPSEYLIWIEKIAEKLPMLSFGAFECYLDAANPRVDFNVQIGYGEQEYLLEQNNKEIQNIINTPSTKQSNELIFKFLEQWKNNEIPYGSLISTMWLVFDLMQDKKIPVRLWTYIMFGDNPFTMDTGLRKVLINKTLEAFEFSTTQIANYQATFDKVPPEVLIGGIGIQTNRMVKDLRIYFQELREEQVFELLKAIDWPGDIEVLRPLLEPLMKDCVWICVGLNIGTKIGDKIGIELGPKEEDYEIFTQKLIELNLITKPQLKSTNAWKGEVEINNVPNKFCWPLEYTKENSQLPEKVKLKTKVSYYKLNYEESKGFSIDKVYLFWDRVL